MLRWFIHFLTMITACGLLTVSLDAQTPQKPIDRANFDTTVNPAVDFYRYANGGWMARNPIPADQSVWGSFNELQDHNYAVLREILENAAADKSAPQGSPRQLVGDFYASGMDSAGIEARGTTPLQDEMNRIQAVTDVPTLVSEIAHLHTIGIGVPFSFSSDQDAKKSTDVIAHINQSGLGLPDRDYYMKKDPASVKIRTAYLDHMRKMLVLAGDDSSKAAASAEEILKMETTMARASMTRVERRDPNATYHRMSVSELSHLTPSLAWNSFLAGIGYPDIDVANVGMPGFMKKIDSMLTSVPIDTWKIYLRWHLLNSTANYLSSPFVNEDFRFSGTVLTGVSENRPRWKRVLETVNRSIGDALGQLYVDKAFPPASKARAREMVMNLKTALHDRIQHLEWMSEETKEKALKKLDAFGIKIGYTDKWKDYSSLKITRDSYLANVLAARNYEFNRNMRKIGRPVDRTEWGMTPPTVNAYYNSNRNEIVFPAGILQPPFYDPNADDAVNYGGMGAVIGHEMTHGFDDEGRKFDAEGNLTDWWTPEDAKNFNARAEMVVKQFDGYVAVDTFHVNGKLTLGENIADLGGLKIAYEAFEKSLEGKPRPEKIDGLTPEQRFFLAWAQIWRTNIRPEAQRLRLNIDPHAPGYFRVNGPLSNLKEFREAFNVPDGSPMARPASDEVKIW